MPKELVRYSREQLMEFVLVLYVILVVVLLVLCSMLKEGAVVRCIPVSRAILDFLGDQRDDLVIINLGVRGTKAVPGALNVRTDQLGGLLHWMPPKTTLVLSGETAMASLPKNVERVLADLHIEVVYILEERRAKSLVV